MGELNVVAEPAGTRKGFEICGAGRHEEHIGAGLRPRVASVADLARMAAALGHELGREPGRGAERLREQDFARSRELRRMMEVEVGIERTLGSGATSASSGDSAARSRDRGPARAESRTGVALAAQASSGRG